MFGVFIGRGDGLRPIRLPPVNASLTEDIEAAFDLGVFQTATAGIRGGDPMDAAAAVDSRRPRRGALDVACSIAAKPAHPFTVSRVLPLWAIVGLALGVASA